MIQARIKQDPAFREELLKKGVGCLLSGEVDTGTQSLLVCAGFALRGERQFKNLTAGATYGKNRHLYNSGKNRINHKQRKVNTTMKKLNILVITALVLGLGVVAQAQQFAEVKLFTTPKDYAREGGTNEAAGSILLNSSAMEALRDPEGAMIDAAFFRPSCGRYNNRHHRW